MKALSFSLLFYFAMTGLTAQVLKTDEANQRVGIRKPEPLYTLHLLHKNGQPTFGSFNGIALENEKSKDTWIIYSSSSAGQLQFYNADVPEVYFNKDGSINQLSDRNYKTNISDMPNGQLARIMQLRPKGYEFTFLDDHKLRYGLIAQEAIEVMPEIVQKQTSDTNNKEIWSVSYVGMVPFLVKAMQEQQTIIEQKTSEIAALEARLARLEAMMEAQQAKAEAATDSKTKK